MRVSASPFAQPTPALPPEPLGEVEPEDAAVEVFEVVFGGAAAVVVGALDVVDTSVVDTLVVDALAVVDVTDVVASVDLAVDDVAGEEGGERVLQRLDNELRLRLAIASWPRAAWRETA